ncbi:hypothetical protein LOD99_4015 [Oopsacas minuta]|uniref:Transposase n=1 Tax=Oopsacas minuta TaxID=111878 RepID=A0AAV7JVH4_9METZ|nr:hypothetical protein LOD99_4015 [Oopsacas minuta]
MGQIKSWLTNGSNPPEKARPDFRNDKVLYSIFFDADKPVAQVPVPKGERLNGEFYVDKCLREFKKVYKTRRPRTGTRGIKLLHDNARPHVSKYVREVIEDIGFETIEHPPYTPDLSLCDFWLFPELKKHLGGQLFHIRPELQMGH